MTDPQSLNVGDQLPTFVRATELAHWNRYAAVNDEFVPIHMDDAAGQAAGYPSAFGMGHLQWSYFHNLLRSWMGETGRIVSVSCQFRGPNIKGQTVTAQGVITGTRQEGNELLVEADLWTDEQSHSQLAIGKAVVAFPL